MSEPTKPTWERFGDAMLEWGGYVLLGLGDRHRDHGGERPDPTWRRRPSPSPRPRGLAVRGCTPTAEPAHRAAPRMRSSSSGCSSLASISCFRQPLFFVFMIAGFFYATALRPLPLAVVGIAASSILVNTLVAGVPQSAEGWTWYLVIIGVQTVVISAGAVFGEKVTEQSEERRQALARLEAALEENAASTRSCSPRPARRASSTSGSGWRARSTTRSPRA
jgi:hypothetical protein